MPGQIEGAVSVPDFPDQCENYDDEEFIAAERHFETALRQYIQMGARGDNIASVIETVIEELG